MRRTMQSREFKTDAELHAFSRQFPFSIRRHGSGTILSRDGASTGEPRQGPDQILTPCQN